MGPVSYTHLDVYKRQMERFLEQNTVPGRPHLSVRNMTGMKLAEIYGKYIRRGIPVMIWSEFEETAVDVYKRQQKFSPARPPCSPRIRSMSSVRFLG